MRVYTRRGDDGTTGLLYGGRISKGDPTTEAYGTVDEAVSALGLARAEAEPGLATLLLRLQRELFVVAADLAANPAQRRKLQPGVSLVTPEMVADLERLIDRTVEDHPLPTGFVVPGANRVEAALDLARTLVRRAERAAVRLDDVRRRAAAEAMRYLNRLSDLLYVLARAEAGGDEEPSRAEQRG